MLDSTPTSLSTTPTNELPFRLLAGEGYIKHDNLTDGIIYLTAYRLFISTEKARDSSIDCPIRSIDSIYIKDHIYLCTQCKYLRSFTLTFFTENQCRYWLRKLTEIIAVPTRL
ncbi:unnamed protein product [Rotaria magnacalcarata]|nr:unnamed protein product [Rotaria magnacalcarata]